MAKIGPKAKISLCWWHLRRAVHTCLANGKLSTTPYNMEHTHTEFPFINPKFKPVGRPDVMEYEGGMHDDWPAIYMPVNQVAHIEKPTYQSTPTSMITSLLPSEDPPIRVGSKADITTPRITIPPQPPPPPPMPKRIDLSAVLKAKKSGEQRKLTI